MAEDVCAAHKEMVDGFREIHEALRGTFLNPGIIMEVAEIKRALKEQGEQLRTITHTIVGDGTPGYSERLRSLEKPALQRALDQEKASNGERQAAQEERRWRRSVLAGVILVFVTQVVMLFRELIAAGAAHVVGGK